LADKGSNLKQQQQSLIPLREVDYMNPTVLFFLVKDRIQNVNIIKEFLR